MSHTPSAECAQLCDEYQSLTEQWINAQIEGDEEALASLGVLIRAVASRMEVLHCPTCNIF
jgi:hypothetical protein